MIDLDAVYDVAVRTEDTRIERSTTRSDLSRINLDFVDVDRPRSRSRYFYLPCIVFYHCIDDNNIFHSLACFVVYLIETVAV